MALKSTLPALMSLCVLIAFRDPRGHPSLQLGLRFAPCLKIVRGLRGDPWHSKGEAKPAHGRLPRVQFLPFSNTCGIIPPLSGFRPSAGSVMESSGLPAGASFRWRSQLPCTLCAIIPVGDDWIVQCATVTQGPFVTKGIALRLAFAEALALHAEGQRSRVSVQDGSGLVSAEHCLCTDFQVARGFATLTPTT